jgi:hypothetical protein
MRPTMFVVSAALMVGVAIPAQAQSAAARATVQAASMEFSAAKRTRNPYEGRATVYNPRGASQEPWGPPSSPGIYGGGF